MWLLNASTFVLEDFSGEDVPKYAILSHAWGPGEVSFRDMRKDQTSAKFKPGFFKIRKSCEQALQEGLKYVWVDTCCIDKSSSAELSEAINSMFRWYQNSRVCYIYLEDVEESGLDPDPKCTDDAFSNSRWFKRGWTLQELLAPKQCIFFTKQWTHLGTKSYLPPQESTFKSKLASSSAPPQHESTTLNSKLAKITRIDARFLGSSPDAWRKEASVAQRLSWVARRETTRPEDIAYSLMGLFEVSMPILYGEGKWEAFNRLQREIISRSADQTIFAWGPGEDKTPPATSLLASSPACFADSGTVINEDKRVVDVFSMTHIGMAISLPLRHSGRPGYSIAVASLRALVDVAGSTRRIGLYLEPTGVEAAMTAGVKRRPLYRRMPNSQVEICKMEMEKGPVQDIIVLHEDYLKSKNWNLHRDDLIKLEEVAKGREEQDNREREEREKELEKREYLDEMDRRRREEEMQRCEYFDQMARRRREKETERREREDDEGSEQEGDEGSEQEDNMARRERADELKRRLQFDKMARRERVDEIEREEQFYETMRREEEDDRMRNEREEELARRAWQDGRARYEREYEMVKRELVDNEGSSREMEMAEQRLTEQMKKLEAEMRRLKERNEVARGKQIDAKRRKERDEMVRRKREEEITRRKLDVEMVRREREEEIARGKLNVELARREQDAMFREP